MIHILGKEKPYQAGEDYFQKAVARFIWFKYPKLIWFHTPNGGFRNGKEAAKFKDMGVRSGVSDLIFLESRMNYNGLIIELKTKKNEITKNQEKFLREVDQRGFLCVICYNFDSVKLTLEKYFNGEDRKAFKN